MAELGLLDPDERVELVDGKIWSIRPQRRPHFRAIRAVADALEEAFGLDFDVQQQAPLVLADDSEPEPDVAVVRGSWGDYEEHPIAADVLIVVEVSDSTLLKDRTRKARSYALSGIVDYWILNLVDRQLEIYRRPDAASGTFLSITILRAAEQASPLAAPQSLIAVEDLLPPPTNP